MKSLLTGGYADLCNTFYFFFPRKLCSVHTSYCTLYLCALLGSRLQDPQCSLSGGYIVIIVGVIITQRVGVENMVVNCQRKIIRR